MAEDRLEGGYTDGAARVGDTVRRAAGPWTPAVPMSGWVSPPLTTIVQPLAQMAAMATRTVLALLDGRRRAPGAARVPTAYQACELTPGRVVGNTELSASTLSGL